MQTKIIEATNGPRNWGKFLVGRMDTEWSYRSEVGTDSDMKLLHQLGWTPEFLWVCDLATGEGGLFRPGGYAHADLNKHRIWVCVLFEPFLAWLYRQDLSDLDQLPSLVDFAVEEAPPAFASYRRPGPDDPFVVDGTLVEG